MTWTDRVAPLFKWGTNETQAFRLDGLRFAVVVETPARVDRAGTAILAGEVRTIGDTPVEKTDGGYVSICTAPATEAGLRQILDELSRK